MNDLSKSNFSPKSVFSLLPERDLRTAELNNGQGVLVESKPWTSAKIDFDSLEVGQKMLLLLGDASRIKQTKSVEWIAVIEKISITYDRNNSKKGKTRINFSALVTLDKAFPLVRLKLRSGERKGQYFSPNHQRPYALCELPSKFKNSSEWLKVAGTSSIKKIGDFDSVDLLTESDFLNALIEIKPHMTDQQIEMLVGHANAPSQCLSMARIAKLGGYQNFRVGNLQYGRLGALFARYFGIEHLPNQTQALAEGISEKDKSGYFQWRLRPALLGALRKQWSELVFQSSEAEQAEEELFDQPNGLMLKPTERASIVQSRIGQGIYRRDMLALWQGRCALTNCDIPEVLIASHAKPWKLCTNQERLDKYNGLLLAAHVDALFDAGLIGFDPDGDLIISPRLSLVQISSLGLNVFKRLRFIKEGHRKYLAEHCRLNGLNALKRNSEWG